LSLEEYDPAIEFFTGILGFDLVEDSPSRTDDGRPKHWVVVRPPAAFRRSPRPSPAGLRS
jgi:catechol 2,3-dioxygenase-like lactoylglutathione lyase family enzyme